MFVLYLIRIGIRHMSMHMSTYWIIILHSLQAQDRLFRIGQQRHVCVYRLIAAGTIEELVYNRQIYKQQLASVGMRGANERRYRSISDYADEHSCIDTLQVFRV